MAPVRRHRRIVRAAPATLLATLYAVAAMPAMAPALAGRAAARPASAALVSATVPPPAGMASPADLTATGGRTCTSPAAFARGPHGVPDPDLETAASIGAGQLTLSLGIAVRTASAGLDPMAQPLTTVDRPRIVVPVYVHVLRTRSAGGVRHRRIVHQVAVLNGAFHGHQSPLSARTPFTFQLSGVTTSRNASWYHMNQGSSAERQAKRALHIGDARDLNLYIGANTDGVLGWGTQPTTYQSQPKLDGVVIADHTLPGGSGGRYSAGDDAVHETGHWLGLFHTFAGGCGRRGDLIADTPAEARPSYTCPLRRNTCAAPGRDPVHNFMDYSWDSCMNQFTHDQALRMKRSWVVLRAGTGGA